MHRVTVNVCEETEALSRLLKVGILPFIEHLLCDTLVGCLGTTSLSLAMDLKGHSPFPDSKGNIHLNNKLLLREAQ